MAAPTDEELIARILEQPETSQIAESLGLSAEDYAARVLFYAKNPEAQPQIETMDPLEEQANGMPSVGECVKFLEKIDSGEISMDPESHQTRFAGFDDEEKSAVTATGGQRMRKGGAPPPPMPGDPSLKVKPPTPRA